MSLVLQVLSVPFPLVSGPASLCKSTLHMLGPVGWGDLLGMPGRVQAVNGETLRLLVVVYQYQGGVVGSST